jgi:hypothetical protein
MWSASTTVSLIDPMYVSSALPRFVMSSNLKSITLGRPPARARIRGWLPTAQ